MAGVRQSKSNLPLRTYLNRNVYYYVHRDTGKWMRLSTNKSEAIRMANELNKNNSLPSKPDYDLSASHEMSATGKANQLRNALSMYASAKQGARSRNLSFELTPQDVIDVLISAKGHCVATGIPFSNKKEPGARIACWKPSLDRIDSSKGYILGNVRAVCVMFNIAVQDHGDSMFKKLAVGFLKTAKDETTNQPAAQQNQGPLNAK